MEVKYRRVGLETILDALPVSGNHSNSQFVSCGSSPLLHGHFTSIKNGRKTLQKHAICGGTKEHRVVHYGSKGSKISIKGKLLPRLPQVFQCHAAAWILDGGDRASERGPRAVIRPRRNTRLGSDSSPTATNKLATAARRRCYPEIRPPSG